MTEDSRSPEDSAEGPAVETSSAGSDGNESETTNSSLLAEALAALESLPDSDDDVIPEEAMFSPDDPIVREGEERGVATGMGGEAAAAAVGGEGDLAWEIQHAANIMSGLARALREQGMDALKVHSENEPMDAVLRSFIAGYLVGRTDPEE